MSSSDDTFVVYRGWRQRKPDNAARVVAEDGTAWHVMRPERTNEAASEPMPFDEALREACRCAGREI